MGVLRFVGVVLLLVSCPALCQDDGDTDYAALANAFLEACKANPSLPCDGKEDPNKPEATSTPTESSPSDTDMTVDPCDCPESFNATKCVCVDYYSCDTRTNEVFQHGQGDEVIRVSSDNRRPIIVLRGNECPTYSLTCCKSPGNATELNRLSAAQKKPPPAGAPTFAATAGAPTPTPLQAGPAKCGNRKPKGVGPQIVQAKQETQFGEFPWMVGIHRMHRRTLKPKRDTFWCGGALIAPTVVVTAAHCVKSEPLEILKVRAGDWDRNNSEVSFGLQEMGVMKKIVHKDHYGGNQRNDIALLILDKAVVRSDYVDFVCVPQPSLNVDNECVYSGWGKVDKDDTEFPTIMKKKDVDIVSRADCEKAILKHQSISRTFTVHQSHVCAGTEGGACVGDGGSPLVCQAEDADYYALVGLGSWGVGQCSEEPSLFTNVPEFRNWIDQQLQNENIDTSTYRPPGEG